MALSTLSYSLAFCVHFIAMAVAFGAAVCDTVVNAAFWRQLETSPPKAEALAALMRSLGTVAALGGLATLGSGLALLASLGFAQWGEGWLSIKLFIFVFLTANGLLFAKSRKRRIATLVPLWATAEARGGLEVGGALAARTPNVWSELRRIESSLTIFHRMQLGAFLVVFVVAVFKVG